MTFEIILLKASDTKYFCVLYLLYVQMTNKAHHVNLLIDANPMMCIYKFCPAVLDI